MLMFVVTRPLNQRFLWRHRVLLWPPHPKLWHILENSGPGSWTRWVKELRLDHENPNPVAGKEGMVESSQIVSFRECDPPPRVQEPEPGSHRVKGYTCNYGVITAVPGYGEYNLSSQLVVELLFSGHTTPSRGQSQRTGPGARGSSVWQVFGSGRRNLHITLTTEFQQELHVGAVIITRSIAHPVGSHRPRAPTPCETTYRHKTHNTVI